MNKKRHHYVPKAYLKSFCDERGRVGVYRKDDPRNPNWQSPDNVGFRRYYYSQTIDGRRDNGLEELFSRYESGWPSLVDRLRRGDDVNDDDSLALLYNFMTLQRVRVPAFRDIVENVQADFIKSKLRAMDAVGKLPPKSPTGNFLNLGNRM